MARAVVAAVVIVVLFLAAVWPPSRAPQRWRRATRPLRRRLRPGHYRGYG